jgi:hypothetical protein
MDQQNHAVEPESTPIMSRQDVANALMRISHGIMKRMGRLYRPFVSPSARKVPGEYYSMLVSQLPNRRGDLVGEVRIKISVPESRNLDISVMVEWTRDAFGFWYQEEIRMENSDDPTKAFMDQFVKAMKWVKTTADGTVRVASMNRLHKKVRKNSVKDRAARAGLTIG